MPRSGGRSKKQWTKTRLVTDAVAAQPHRGDSGNLFRALAPADHDGPERGEQAGVEEPEQTEEMADDDAGAASNSRGDDGQPSPTDDEHRFYI